MPSALLGSILAIAPLAIQVQITGTQARVKVQVVKNWNSPCEHSRSTPSLPSSPSWEPRQLPSSPSLPWCELLGLEKMPGCKCHSRQASLNQTQEQSLQCLAHVRMVKHYNKVQTYHRSTPSKTRVIDWRTHITHIYIYIYIYIILFYLYRDRDVLHVHDAQGYKCTVSIEYIFMHVFVFV